MDLRASKVKLIIFYNINLQILYEIKIAYFYKLKPKIKTHLFVTHFSFSLKKSKTQKKNF